jgi:hypothetical protein
MHVVFDVLHSAFVLARTLIEHEAFVLARTLIEHEAFYLREEKFMISSTTYGGKN